ncbi:hypothetical protein RF11_10171 [Thelohanellus kitauei]|uniref:Uncharacterized protein n=1 Tax=Thelohanellus kitauei TaxID=669202 RepID=A0A0C2MNX5_THEKT|nr:hypothetical protein RF11_10171 [Thelohanellus kitauei]
MDNRLRCYWVNDIYGQMHRIIILVTNESLALVRYNTRTFIDRALKVIYHPFYQYTASKVKKYHISNSNLKIILQKIELLTIIHSQQILDAVECLKSLLVHEEALDKFWSYLKKIRVVPFLSDVWNTFNILQSHIMNRTNNALDR